MRTTAAGAESPVHQLDPDTVSTRDLDRYEIRRRGGELAIDLAVLYRIDRDPQAWSRAFVQIA